MAKGYRPVARDQQFLLPPDMREWLPADHPVWLVISAVADHLDTSAFHAARRLGGAGGGGVGPGMAGTLLGWGYAKPGARFPRGAGPCPPPSGLPGGRRGGAAPHALGGPS